LIISYWTLNIANDPPLLVFNGHLHKSENLTKPLIFLLLLLDFKASITVIDCRP
jgi:hypothetical protein